MRILYFSRDYTPHDHRFLEGLARYIGKSFPEASNLPYPRDERDRGKGINLPSIQKVYYLRLERGNLQTEDRPLPAGVEQISWAGGHQPVSRRQGMRLFLNLRQVIAKVKPDLIQAGPLQRSAFLVALTGYRPLVSMSWGYDLLIDAERSPSWRWATRYTLRHSAALVGDCDTIRRLAISYGMDGERIVTFPWGVDLQHFSPPNPLPEDNSTFTLLSTRAWEPLYGVTTIAQAFVIAARTVPGLRLIMLGGGSLSGELHHIFSQSDLEERVSFPGHVGYADLKRYYQMADLYISASHSDGSSISLLEAMACGRPALVSDIPGNREWVTPEENGWRYSEGNAGALVEAILYAVKNRHRLLEMGLVARRVAERRADWKVNFPKIFTAYRLALESQRAL